LRTTPKQRASVFERNRRIKNREWTRKDIEVNREWTRKDVEINREWTRMNANKISHQGVSAVRLKGLALKALTEAKGDNGESFGSGQSPGFLL
jgi:hypothetical protein